MAIQTLGYEPKMMVTRVSRKTNNFWPHDQENTKELFLCQTLKFNKKITFFFFFYKIQSSDF